MIRKSSLSTKFFWITLFSIAMGLLETVVVIYLREIYYPDGFAFPLRPIAPNLIVAEFPRAGYYGHAAEYWVYSFGKSAGSFCLVYLFLCRVGHFLLCILKTFPRLARIFTYVGCFVPDPHHMGRSGNRPRYQCMYNDPSGGFSAPPKPRW